MASIPKHQWPEFSYHAFQSTGYLLHRVVQMIGKLKLNTPFEPHWANVALSLTASGLTSGLISFEEGVFSIELDFIHHNLEVLTSWGTREKIKLRSQSVAEFYQQLFQLLKKLKINLTINPMPQEIPNSIAFNKDVAKRDYHQELATNWWKILTYSYLVMQRYRARFNGETPPIGLMWGTFDLRDARYNGKHVTPTGINAGYLRRNAMDEEQIESGFWPGNEMYPHAAFYSFTYPQPASIENNVAKPAATYWNKDLGEFVLNYADLIKENNPDQSLLEFFESTYQIGSQLGGWKKEFIMQGEPV